ncbi:MAG: hypothetical protein DI535_12200 [Citrobacter freundii]|nr:MAG: hypothetical protein DI535_12200 [Citrobacter freundii]
MAKSSQIRQHSLREIFQLLGEEVQRGAEFHIHYNDEPFLENPFPYPFRSNNTGVILLLEGQLRMKINLESYVAEAGSIMILPSQQVLDIREVIKPVKTIGLAFTDEYARRNSLHVEDINILRYFSLHEMPVIPLAEPKRNTVFHLLETMYRLNQPEGESGRYKDQKTFHYFNLLALEVIEAYRSEIEKIDIKTARRKEIIQSFLDLLSVHIREERSVQFYADKLFITPGHLSKLLKEASGSTARDVIEDAVVMEARNLLKDPSLSLAQIAEDLNFSDPSFFGKFFKKKMNMTPKTYRDTYR